MKFEWLVLRALYYIIYRLFTAPSERLMDDLKAGITQYEAEGPVAKVTGEPLGTVGITGVMPPLGRGGLNL